ncbi:MAG TPA: XrtA system polysaccharide chain length determinant [Terriglobales bacterium]|nr:XrtA system polysaccharide chain length determinant [Terriglobales bacterium]
MENYEGKPSRTFEDYWAIACRRRWWLILPLFLGWVFVMVAGRFIPPKYRSETVIIVEQQGVSEQYRLANIATDVQEQLQSMTQQILSRTRLQGIISRFRLYGQNQETGDSDASVERMRRDIKIDLMPAPGRPGDLSAFKISYSAPTPALAQQVTSELTSLFINENLHDRQRFSENTTEFLDNQLGDARRDLAQQEERLRDFKSRNLGELPEQWQSNEQILSTLQTRLQSAEETLDEANQQELYLESLSPHYLGGASENPEATPASVDEQLDRLNAELADLSTHYTANHPDVRRVKEKIAATEKLKQQLEAQTPSHPSEKSTGDAGVGKSQAEAMSSSSMLPMSSQVRANKLRIAHREQEVKSLERQIEAYQARLNQMPLKEQQLADITRDYDQTRANYESLLAKKTQSEMATSFEKRQQGELFSIIDPPNLPLKPYWPDRFKLSLLGGMVGILLALAITAFMEIYDPRIYRAEELRDLIPAPVLAGIPVLQTPSEQRKQHWHQRLEALAGSALIGVIPLMTLFTYFRG